MPNPINILHRIGKNESRRDQQKIHRENWKYRRTHLICLWWHSSPAFTFFPRGERNTCCSWWKESCEWWCSRLNETRVWFFISPVSSRNLVHGSSWTSTAWNIFTRIGHHKVKHLMGIMNRPLATTSVSIIWHHIVINNTWALYNGKDVEVERKIVMENFSLQEFLLLMFYNRRVDSLRPSRSLPRCTNFPINNSMLMDPNNAAHTRTLSHYARESGWIYIKCTFSSLLFV